MLPTKSCSKCKIEKKWYAFSFSSRTKDGKASTCKLCINSNKDYQNQKKQYAASDAGRLVEMKSHLKTKFGISIEQKERMFQEQNGQCAICLKELASLKSACVDHDHVTGKVRDLLCKPCNSYLGKIEKNKEVLKNLNAYVEKHRS